jgi:O-antigen/teichoic acid export membrane protein
VVALITNRKSRKVAVLSETESIVRMGSNLRTKVLAGGAYLGIRQLVGMLLSLVGMLVVARLIGPRGYGLYAAALGIYSYAFNLGQLGISVYLVRQAGEIEEQDYQQASTVLAILGIIGSVALVAGVPLLIRWVPLVGLVPVLRGLIVCLPVQLLTLPATAKLDRTLAYRKIAVIELVGQISYLVAALSLALRDFGPWSLLVGYWLQQVTLCLLFHRAARYVPRFHWDVVRIRKMLAYGISYSNSVWVWQLRSLVNPLIVGRFLGAEAVGYVGVSIRIVEVLSFIKQITYRISIAALAKLQNDRKRLLSAINEGMRLQCLAIGPPLVCFALVGPWIMPVIFGQRWVPVLSLYPFIALSYLTNALFNLHSSALYVLTRNWSVTAFHLAHIVLFFGGAFVFIPLMGLRGYGWAEVAALISYIVVHRSIVRYVGMPDYQFPVVWWGAMALALFWRDLGIWTIAVLLAVLIWPRTLSQLREYFVAMKRITDEV